MPKSPKFKRPKEVETSVVKLTRSAAKRSKSSSSCGGGGEGKVVVGGGKKGKVNDKIKPVAKIPSSREESSSNWKALLFKQGKSLPDIKSVSSSQRRMDSTSSESKRPLRNSEGSDSDSLSRSASNSRCSSQLSMTSEAASSNGADKWWGDDTDGEGGGESKKDASQKVKQEFRALGLSESEPKPVERKSRSLEKAPKLLRRVVVKKLPPEGLNEFGYFDYSHYGVLRTPITPAHAEFTVDTGIVAMDCEMVGVGPMKESALARVSIVNEYGYCLYDRFVKPKCEVTDYRTQYSGVRENDLKNAMPFKTAAEEVARLLKDHILVGHSLKSDLGVLHLGHPKARQRDTASYFKKMLHSKTPKLKMLVKKLLGVEIQTGEHSSITDAQATMALYQLYQRDWEISVKQSNRGIDVFKLCLEEFKQQSKSSHSQTLSKDWYAPSNHPNPPNSTQSSYAYASNQNVAPPVVFSAYSGSGRNDAGYGGYSAGVSPSESPTDPSCYEAYNFQDEGIIFEEPPSYQYPISAPNLAFIPYPGPLMPPLHPHAHQVMPQHHHPIHAPVHINYCQFGVVVPPQPPPQAMHFPQQFTACSCLVPPGSRAFVSPTETVPLHGHQPVNFVVVMGDEFGNPFIMKLNLGRED